MNRTSALLLIICIIVSCSNIGLDLSTPEKNHLLLISAVNYNDLETWAKCFVEGKEILAAYKSFEDPAGYLKRTRVLSSDVLEKKMLTDNEASYIFIDVIEKKTGELKLLTKVKYQVSFMKVGKGWKVQSSNTLSATNKIWADGKWIDEKSFDYNLFYERYINIDNKTIEEDVCDKN